MTEQDRTALVLGANGGVGGEIARALLKRGWTVKALVRDVAGAGRRWNGADGAPEWIAGDAMDGTAVLHAAGGVSVIVHAVNPPGYRDWHKLVLPMLDNTIAAAKNVGATIVLPGTVYNFGPDAFADPSEHALQRPVTRKGRIRVEMEKRLRDASDVGARSLIVRCGDFFGARVANNWFSQGLISSGKPVTSISYPGSRGVGHQWAYLPDVGETVAQLLERRDALAPFDVFNMEGHWDHDGARMVEAIRQAIGKPHLRVSRFPWWAIVLGSPFVSLFREMREMRYLWRVPLRMRNGKLVRLLGEEPHTDWNSAVATTLRALGSLKT